MVCFPKSIASRIMAVFGMAAILATVLAEPAAVAMSPANPQGGCRVR